YVDHIRRQSDVEEERRTNPGDDRRTIRGLDCACDSGVADGTSVDREEGATSGRPHVSRPLDQATGVNEPGNFFDVEQVFRIASPRKPNVETPTRSDAFLILEVPCLASASGTSSAAMPAPSSLTRMSFLPPSSIAISIVVAPASIEFSTSSLTTEDGRSTTSPAAIWSATAGGRMEITDMVISKFLPVLAPRRRRDVHLLTLAP